MNRILMTAAGAVFLLAAGGCSLILDPELGAGANAGLFASECLTANDCESNLCRFESSFGRCTQTCSAAAPCPTEGNAVCDPTGQCRFRSPPAVSGALKVGLLYVGPVGDHGWTLTHERGRQYFTERLTGVESHFAPTVAPADAPSVVDDFIARGDNVLIGTSFDFLGAFQNKALNNPKTNFLICSGFQTGPNLGSYFGRMYQVMYMAGQLAARTTRTKHVGVVGPVVIPETVRHLNAFTRGVRAVDPSVRVYIRWVGAWFNPPVEEQATDELIDLAGVDVVFGFTDTAIPVQRACLKSETTQLCTRMTRTSTSNPLSPVYSIGYDNRDTCDFASDRCIASAFWNWGPMVTRLLGDIRAGTWLPEVPIWEQMKSDPEESSVYLAINPAVTPTNVQVDVEALIPQLTPDNETARMLPFQAPVKDVSGAERAPLTDLDLLRMCWLVEGIYNVDGSAGTVPPECVGDR